MSLGASPLLLPPPRSSLIFILPAYPSLWHSHDLPCLTISISRVHLSFLPSSSMAPFRNFLTRRSGVPNGAQTENSNENARPSDSHRSTPLSIKSSDKVSPPEYKLSGMWLSLISIRYTLVIQLYNFRQVRPLNSYPCATVVDDNGSYLPVFLFPYSRVGSTFMAPETKSFNSHHHQRNRVSGAGIQAQPGHQTIIIATSSMRTSPSRYLESHSTPIVGHS